MPLSNHSASHVMKHLPYLILLVVFLACSNQAQQISKPVVHQESLSKDNQYQWTKVLESADWKKSYNFQMFHIKDKLWVFHPEGCWHSSDGKQWTKSTLSNIIHNQAFLDYVQFNDAIYGLGRFEGNIETYDFKPEIFRTSDGQSWESLSKTSNLPHRFFYHPFVFDNKIWIIGGEDKHKQYADIWNSVDGVQWKKQKDNLPFGARSGSKVVQFKGKLFLLNNDVWSSTDGLHWQLETSEILPNETLFGYSAIVFDEKIWLLGCNRNGQFESQVFVSNDGKTWTGQDAPWSSRGGMCSAVFDDKIFMTGGKYGGLVENGTTTEFVYSNDVWALGEK